MRSVRTQKGRPFLPVCFIHVAVPRRTPAPALRSSLLQEDT